MTTPEITLAVQQPEPVTMFDLTPGEGAGFELTLTTWTLDGYERAVFHLSPRIASAFKGAVAREIADVPPPPPLSQDDLVRIHRETSCAMTVDLPAVLGPAAALLTTNVQRATAIEAFAVIAVVEGPHIARAWLLGMNPDLGDDNPLRAIAAGRGAKVLAAARDYARGDNAN